MIRNRFKMACHAGLVMLLLLLPMACAWAQQPPAGIFIQNQASVTYVDIASGLTSTLTSNVVRTKVAPLEAVLLTANHTITSAPSFGVNLSHRITNTGNTPTEYQINFANQTGDSYDLLGLALYRDVVANGIADSGEPRIINGSTIYLNPGEFADLVLTGVVPGTVAQGNTAIVILTATSTTQLAVTASNLDSVISANTAILSLNKNASSTKASPGDTIEFTLNGSNSGLITATGIPTIIDGVPATIIVVRDQIPANTTFQSVTASGTTTTLYHHFGDSTDAYTTTLPTDFARIDTIAFGLASITPGTSYRVSFKVKVNANASGIILNTAVARYSDGASPAPVSLESNTSATSVGVVSPTIQYFDDAAFTKPTAVSALGAPLYIEASAAQCNASPTTIERRTIIITSQRTSDRESFDAVETGPNTGQFQILPSVATRDGVKNGVVVGNSILDTIKNDVLSAEISGCGAGVIHTEILIDPLGIVFDSKTGLPVPGTTVKLIDVIGAGNGGNAGGPAHVFLDDGVTPSPSEVVTGADGVFAFPTVAPSTYRLIILPPPGYRVPSTMPQALLPLAPDGLTYTIGVPGSYGGDFPVSSLTGAVKLDVPLDKSEGVSGTVFDSLNNTLITNAVVTLIDGIGAPAKVFAANGVTPISNIFTTGADGRYEFPVVLEGTYQILVNRGEFNFPSVVPITDLPPGHSIDAAGSYGKRFSLAQTQGGIAIDLPIDATPLLGLFAQKTAGRDIVEMGDFLDYTVKIKNTGSGALSNVVVNDILPSGFSYYPGTARLEGKTLADPIGAKGKGLNFAIGTIEAGKIATLTYRARIGPGALQGDGINHASAYAGPVNSNQASTRTIVQGGVFSDQGYIVGKVFADCNRNGIQDKGELGIPGVRMYLEDGTFVISDAEGKYSFYGVSPRTHVLKLDTTTMPKGSELISLSNRNVGDAGSQFVDIKNGGLHKANFGEGSCSKDVLAQIDTRRAQADTLAQETERAVKVQMTADGVPLAISDPKAQPAAGILGENNKALVSAYTPLLAPGASATGVFPQLKSAAESSATLDMDKEIRALDNTLAFIGVKDKDTLPYAQTRVYVKGVAGLPFELKVNGEIIPASRVGKKSTIADKQLEAWEYIGVNLKPGSNALIVSQLDANDKPSTSAALTLVAPDQLGRFQIIVPPNVSADGITPILVKVKLTDVAGVPVTVRTPITLETSLGRFDVEDLNKLEPGEQVFISGGAAEFRLLPPQEPGAGLIRVTSGIIKAEARIDFMPDLRPLIGAGIIEGVINMRNINTNRLVLARTQDGFDQELKHLSRTNSNGKFNTAARTAFFLKGKVKGEYLLTAAYDSDKNTRDRLFRDIQPDEFYPVYGDSATKGFDAQSTGRFYVRIDKERSYLLFGDYTTQSYSTTRQLATYNRSLTGIKEHYETDRVSINAFASRDSVRQVVDEFRANGTSGPFTLTKQSGLVNSEKIEVITRDRNQPSIILSTVQKSRFTDYEIEAVAGRILFAAPIASVDRDLNPVSIRVSYEVDQGGEKFWVYGADVQVKITEKLEVGGSYVEDRNPQDPASLTGAKKLAGINAAYKLGDDTYVSGEIARTEGFNGQKGTGKRIELKHQSDKLEARAHWGKTDAAFDNPNSNLNQGRSEAGAKAIYRLTDSDRVLAEAIHTEDVHNNGKRDGQLVSIEHSFGNNMRIEAGMRHAKETVAPAQPETTGLTPNEFTTLRGRLTAQVPYLPQASVYGEYEQDIHNSDRKTLALGGEYQIANRAKIYGRHELISSINGPFTLNTTQKQNTTVFGIDTEYMKDGNLFSEYRQRDVLTGREAEAAVGLRNRWHVAEGWTLDTGFERIHSLDGNNANNESASATFGLEYTGSDYWRGSGRLEFHRGSSNDTVLGTFGIASKLSRDWTFLGRNIVSITKNKGFTTGDKLDERMQLGVAYRETDNDRWNGLARIEYRYEDDETQLEAIKRNTRLLSTHWNYQPSKPLVLSGRYAGKWITDHTNGLNTKYNLHLISGRVTYDLTTNWDIGLNVSTLFSRGFSDRQRGLGVEVGYALTANLWASGGYNVFGYREDDLTGGEYTNRGFFLRLRYKFDEDLFSTKDSKVNNNLTMGTAR
jgi:large repetitive protein